jgi:hypothetical protein
MTVKQYWLSHNIETAELCRICSAAYFLRENGFAYKMPGFIMEMGDFNFCLQLHNFIKYDRLKK